MFQHALNLSKLKTSKHNILFIQTCASSAVRELCLPAKEMYLQWAAVTQGVGKARQVYHR